MPDDRLAQQIAFLIEVDKLKKIVRRTVLVDSSRLENSAEHSWHLVLAALVLREYTCVECNLPHVLTMLAVHDLVEIDAGDTSAYDAASQHTRAQREIAAADRIFGLLPPDQRVHLRALWEEFEAQETPESRFAHAVDRFQPLLQSAFAADARWNTPYPSRDQVLRRMAPVESVLPRLWPAVLEMIESLSASGLLHEPAKGSCP